MTRIRRQMKTPQPECEARCWCFPNLLRGFRHRPFARRGALSYRDPAWLTRSAPSSLLGVLVRGRRMLVRVLAVLLSRGGVLLRGFVLANVVLMGGRMMMMRGCMMVSCGVMMMLARGMFR